MSNRPLDYLRGVLVVGLVLLMAAASSGALGHLGRFATSGTQLARVASQQFWAAAPVRVAVAENADDGGSDNGDNSGSDNSDNSGSDNGDNSDNADAFGIAAVDNGDNSGSDNSDNSGSDNSGSDNQGVPVAPAPAAPSSGPACGDHGGEWYVNRWRQPHRIVG